MAIELELPIRQGDPARVTAAAGADATPASLSLDEAKRLADADLVELACRSVSDARLPLDAVAAFVAASSPSPLP